MPLSGSTSEASGLFMQDFPVVYLKIKILIMKNTATFSTIYLSLFLLSQPFNAQVPSLVKDIMPGNADSSPNTFTNVNGTVFFQAIDANGSTLWKSDGTTAGTVMVKNINPVSAGALDDKWLSINNNLYFKGDDGVSGTQLWKSDGTSAGTKLLVDLSTYGTTGANPAWLTNVNGTLFFRGGLGTNGGFLWKSDGTVAGTVKVDPSSGLWGIDQFTAVNKTLFFSAANTVMGNGSELWKSDGTPSGTVLVKDINSGSTGSNPESLININGTLFFRADDGINGGELWKSDGTEAGTVLVKDIKAGSGNSYIQFLTNVNGVLFFLGYDAANGGELWKSDGTAAGTVLVKDIAPGAGSSDVKFLTNVNGTLYFYADDGVNGGELWKSDGTTGGTVMVDGTAGSSYPDNLVNVNGTLYFAAYNGLVGGVLWKSDGTPGGTVVVDPSTTATYCDKLANANGTLFFVAGENTNGREPWALNTTPALAAPAPPTVLTANPTLKVIASNKIYLSWTDNANNEDGFKMERSPNGSTGWSQVGQTAKNISTYIDSTLAAGTTYYFRVLAYNVNGSSIYSNVVSATTLTGIHGNQQIENSVNIYPNPSSGMVTMELELVQNEALGIKIANTLGQIIKEEQHNFVSGNNIVSFDLNGFTNGIYFVQVISDKGILCKKLLVEK